GDRVTVRVARGQIRAELFREPPQVRRACIAGVRDLFQLAGVAAVGDAKLRARYDVGEWRERRDREVERAGEEDDSMSGGSMFADPAKAGRERVREDDLAERFRAVLEHLLDRRAVVVTVEPTEELTAVAALGREHRRDALREVEHATRPLVPR